MLSAPPETVRVCLTTTECLRFVEGGPDSPPSAEVHRHLDDCDTCRTLVAEAVRATVGGPSAAPRPVLRVLADGERLGDRYTIRRFVARGGMGEVYEADDNMLGGRVALKTFAITASDQADAAESLLREVRIARKVIHPNVCRILELGIHRRREAPHEAIPFLTMDFLEGETLAQRIAQAPLGDPAQIARLVCGMAAGLGAVHHAGIVHRDFKSENVFLVRRPDGEEHPVVMDFGLARVFDGPSISHSSNARRLVGTAAYMAPEQLTGLPTTAATDVFALGLVTFELLTGRLPYAGDSLAAVALARLHQAAPAPTSIRPDLDPRWDQIVGRCLEREPASRFAGVHDVAAAIEKLGEKPPSKKTRQPSARLRVAIVGLSIASAVTLAGAFRARSPADVPPTAEHSVGSDSPPAPTVAKAREGTVATSQSTAPEGPSAYLITSDPIGLRSPTVGADHSAPKKARPRPPRALPRKPSRPTLLDQGTVPTPTHVSPPEMPAGEDPLKPATPRPKHPDDLADPF